ncbi:MAG TPA: cupin domain-containing protein [Chloroflexota bacterium]|jgi:mannose-6-phosphate isomerase-like protein (cupin superfamily)|nr:cupin domain-containing protein [Chloroflexota bacterium]
MAWQTAFVRASYDALAPDGSEIRELVRLDRGSMVHCTLRRGTITKAVRHRSVDEMWYCLAGAGELWRGDGAHAEIVALRPGVCVTISCGVSFQFRANQTLELMISTMPPWPGADEAIPAQGAWPNQGHKGPA